MKKVLAILISVSMVLTMFSSLSYGYDDAEMSIQETESETVSSAISEEVQVGISEEAEQVWRLLDAGMISVRGSSASEHINGAVKTVKVNGSEFPEDKCSYKPYNIPWIYGDYVKLYIEQSDLRGFLEAEGEDKTEITGWGIQVTGDGNIGNPWTPGLEDAPVLENGQYVFTFPLQPSYGATVKTIDITISVKVISDNCKITLDANGGVVDPENGNLSASKVIKVKKGVKFSEPDETPFKKMSVGTAENGTRYIKNYVFDRWTKSGEDVKFPLEIEHDSTLEANYKEYVYSYDNYYDFKVMVDVDGEEKELSLKEGNCYLSMKEEPAVSGDAMTCKFRFFLFKDFFDQFVQDEKIEYSDIKSVSAEAHGEYNFIDVSDDSVKVDSDSNKFASQTHQGREYYFWEFRTEMNKDWGYFDGGEIKVKLEPKTKTFTVTFDSAGGEFYGDKNVIVNDGERVIEPQRPTKNGYTFKHWALDGEAYNFNSAVTKDLTLVAVYEVVQVGPNPGEQNPGQQDPGEQDPEQQDPEQDQSSPNQDQGSQSSNEDEKNGDNEIVDVGQEETPLSGVTGEEENKEEHSDLLGTNVNNENNGDSVIVELNQEEVAMGTGVEIDKSSDLALDGGKVASSELPYTKGGTPLKCPYILGGALMVLIGLATKISIKKNK